MSRRILIIVDKGSDARSLAKLLKRRGYTPLTASGPEAALTAIKHQRVDLILSDFRMPQGDGVELLRQVRTRLGGRLEIPFIILSGSERIESAIRAVKEGAYDFIVKPVNRDELLLTLEKALETYRIRRENVLLREALEAATLPREIIGQSPAILGLLEMIRMVASSDATVLLLGESGTGKELAAEAIHRLSPRAAGPLVKVNCAAIPSSLLEDDLFGHEKGAFTGAVRERKGRFELADSGTLFLDEIGDMPFPLQAKLLRVLQERAFERVGGTKTLEVDVRLIASTNQDLEEKIRRGEFREDLYYRLKVVPLTLPPLRERKEDLPLLADHFLKRFREKYQRPIKGLTPEALERIQAYPWPGNVRELENALERAVLLCEEEWIPPDLLPRQTPGPMQDDVIGRILDAGIPLEAVEQRLLQKALERHGNQTRAARALGLTRRVFQYRVKKPPAQPA